MRTRRLKKRAYNNISHNVYYYISLKIKCKQGVQWNDDYVYDQTFVNDCTYPFDVCDKWVLGSIHGVFDDGDYLLPMTSWKAGTQWTEEVDVSIHPGYRSMARQHLKETVVTRLNDFVEHFYGPNSKHDIVESIECLLYNQNDLVVEQIDIKPI